MISTNTPPGFLQSSSARRSNFSQSQVIWFSILMLGEGPRLSRRAPPAAKDLGWTSTVVLAVPVPVRAAAVFRRLFELVLGEIGAIAAEVGIVLQGLSLIHISEPTRRTPISY